MKEGETGQATWPLCLFGRLAWAVAGWAERWPRGPFCPLRRLATHVVGPRVTGPSPVPAQESLSVFANFEMNPNLESS